MAEIILKESGKKVIRLPLDHAGITVGSHADNEIVLQGEGILSRHGRIIFHTSGQYIVETLSPDAVLLLNGKHVHGSSSLKTGDELSFGCHTMILDLDERRRIRQPASPLRPEPTIQFIPSFDSNVNTDRLLWISEGKVKGEYSLEKDHMIIGRWKECDIVIDHETVSKSHAQVSSAEDGHIVKDLGSLNGIQIHGKNQALVHLRGGEIIRLGKVDLLYVQAGNHFDPVAAQKKKAWHFLWAKVAIAMGFLALLVIFPGLIHAIRDRMIFSSPSASITEVDVHHFPLNPLPRSVSMGNLLPSGSVGILLIYEDRLEVWSRNDSRPQHVWSAHLPLHLASSPQLLDLNGDGRQEIVAVIVGPKVICLDGATGTLTPWGASLPEYPDTDMVPCWADENGIPDVAIGTRDGRVRFLSGRRYLEEIRPPFYVQEAISSMCSSRPNRGGSILFIGAGRHIYAYDAGKGSIGWNQEVGEKIMDVASFVSTTEVWVACMCPGSVYLFDGNHGTPITRVTLPAPSSWPPISSQCDNKPGFYLVLIDGTVFFLSREGLFSPLSGLSGASMAPLRANLTKDTCTELIIPRTQELLLWSQGTGELVGRLPLSFPLRCVPALGDWTGKGKLSLVGLDDGGLQILDTQILTPAHQVAWPGKSEWRITKATSMDSRTKNHFIIHVIGVSMALTMIAIGSIHEFILSRSRKS